MMKMNGIKMSEEEAIKELKNMSREEIDLVPYDTLKLICQAKGCNRHTKVRDYGLQDTYYSNRFIGKEKWHNIKFSFFLCAKHWKWYDKLTKRFDIWHVQEKMLDKEKQKTQKI